MSFLLSTVLERREIVPGVISLWTSCHEEIKPGQFFMLRRKDSGVLLPRAISVCDVRPGQVRFLVQTVGPGTQELSQLQEGQSFHLTGPLGNGFPVELPGRVALVGGGIGIAPLLYTARFFHGKGVPADVVLGFRDQPFLMDELEPVSNCLLISTESGVAGTKGFVTQILEPEIYSHVLCCGPVPMMKAVVELCIKADTPVYVSMENKMACGIGACLVCTCTDKEGKNRRTCKDGPVFRGEEVDFDA